MNRRVVFLNIETRPELGSHWEQFRDLVKLGVRTSPEAIVKHQNQEAPKLWKQTATDPFRAHCFVFTIMALEDAEPEVVIDDNEGSCIRKLEEWIRVFREESKGAEIEWHTFNGTRFDHPVLRLRAIKYGCGLLAQEMEVPRYGNRHVDWFFKMGVPYDGKGPIRGKLDNIARFLNINHPNPITGGEIVDAWTRGNLEAITLHTRSRVLILRDMYNKLRSIEMPPAEGAEEEE